MPPDSTATAVLDAPAATPAPSESAQAGSGGSDYQRVDFDSLFDDLPDDPPAALGDDATPAADASTPATDAKPAAGDEPASVTAPEKPAEPSTTDESSRRKNVGAEKDAEIARLAAELATATTDREAAIEAARAEAREQALRDKPAQDEAAALAASAQADAERYRTLLETPDHEISPEDYTWREDRKALLKQYPEAERHFKTEADAQVAAAQAEAKAFQTNVLNGVASEFRALSTMPGVDAESFQKLPSPTDLGRALHAAGHATGYAEGRAELQAENGRLQKENDELRASALGASRAPTVAGHSANNTAPEPAFNPRRNWRANLEDAL